MTVYTFAASSTTQAVNWDDPSVWSGGVVPNSANADVSFPVVTYVGSGAPYISTVTIGQSETFSVRSIDLSDTISLYNGTLNVSGSLLQEAGSSVLVSDGTLAVGSIAPAQGVSSGTLSFNGGSLSTSLLAHEAISAVGPAHIAVQTFSDNTVYASGSQTNLIIDANAFTGESTFSEANNGSITLNSATGFSDLSGGIWSGSNLQVSGGGALNIKGGGSIVVDDGGITLGGGTISTADPSSGQYVALTDTLKTVSGDGVLKIESSSYHFGSLVVSGQLDIVPSVNEYNYYGTQTTTSLAIDNLTVDGGGAFHGSGVFTGDIVNNGSIVVDPAVFNPYFNYGYLSGSSLTIDGNVSGTGHIEVSSPQVVLTGDARYPEIASSTIELSGSAHQNVIFDGNAGTLKIDSPSSFSGSITPDATGARIGGGDVIVLNGVSLSDNPTATYDGNRDGGTLTVHGPSGSLSLSFVGNFTAADFAFSAGPQNLSIDPPSLIITVVGHGNEPPAGTSDLVWYNPGAQTITDWAAETSGFEANKETLGNVAVGTQVVGRFDANLDGHADLLTRDSSGNLSAYDVDGTTFSALPGFSASVDPAWQIKALGNDGSIVWRNGGAFTVWSTSGTGFNQNVYTDNTVSADWKLVASGDFNNDGHNDILWRNENSGAFTEWQGKADFSFNQNTYVNDTVGKDWHLVATGDFNGDGKDDLVWRNDNGHFTIWSSNGSGFDPNTYVNDTVSNDWQIAKVADFNNDGYADLLFRNTQTGTFTEWTGDGHGGFNQNVVVDSSVSTAWQLTSQPHDIV